MAATAGLYCCKTPKLQRSKIDPKVNVNRLVLANLVNSERTKQINFNLENGRQTSPSDRKIKIKGNPLDLKIITNTKELANSTRRYKFLKDSGKNKFPHYWSCRSKIEG